MGIRVAASEEEILACYPAVVQLRPHLNEEEFVDQVSRQAASGYQLAFLEVEGVPVSVAGFRVLEKLSSGRVLHVDDLVSDEAARSRGYGAQLLAWLKERARLEGCDCVQLDSGTQRVDAHRFYEREGMRFIAHHFDWRV